MMNNESKTLFIPLYGKAAMSREGIFTDKTAERIVESLPEKMKNVDISRRLAIFMAMRAKFYDQMAMFKPHVFDNMIVVHLGCGLDSRCERAGSAASMWYDIDLPEVIDLRRHYYQESEHYRMISASITDDAWISQIPYNGEYVRFIMEGVSMYLSAEDMAALFDRLVRHFSFVSFCFDAYTPLAVKYSKYANPINRVNARIDFCMDDPYQFVSDKIRFAGDFHIFQQDMLQKLKPIDRIRFRFLGRFDWKFYRIYDYFLNPPPFVED